MSQRPEWVKCVLADVSEHHPSFGKTWCGQPRGLEFYFQNIDHAALNGQGKGRLVVCEECLAVIVKALSNGYKTAHSGKKK